MTDTDLLTDDEALREQAMLSGPTKCGRWEMRPTAALEISWMQRCKILSPEMDVLWRGSAFAFLHSMPKATIRSLVNDFPRFAVAVDDWMEKQQPTPNELRALNELSALRTAEYFASFSETGGAASGN